jgi:hypothetical protein
VINASQYDDWTLEDFEIWVQNKPKSSRVDIFLGEIAEIKRLRGWLWKITEHDNGSVYAAVAALNGEPVVEVVA